MTTFIAKRVRFQNGERYSIWKGANLVTDEATLVLFGKNGDRITANGMAADVAEIRLVERIYCFSSNSLASTGTKAENPRIVQP
jgi:hypothetical protein